MLNGKIAEIQSSLNLRYSTRLVIDNLFGPETKKALVIALQTELNVQYGANLVTDGIFGVKTKSACINVYYGAKGNITWLIQAMLYCRGYNAGGLDYEFGDEMLKAVKCFQVNNGLTADGIVGKNTFEKLFV